MTRSLRDTQKSKVYTSERTVSYSKKFETMDEVNAYVARIVRSAFWKKMKGAHYIHVKDGRGLRNAYAYDWGTIALPKWARHEVVILHELSHTLVNFDNYNNVPSHGREFASMFLKLVKRYMGKQSHDELKRAFKTNHVHYVVRKQA
jgi:putative metallohydrolase (TIGR04338 family)